METGIAVSTPPPLARRRRTQHHHDAGELAVHTHSVNVTLKGHRLRVPGRAITATTVGAALIASSAACGDPVTVGQRWTGDAKYRTYSEPDPSSVPSAPGEPALYSYFVHELSGVIDGKPQSTFREKCSIRLAYRQAVQGPWNCLLAILVDGKAYVAHGQTPPDRSVYGTLDSAASPGVTFRVYNRGYPKRPGPNRVEIVASLPS